jgi:putative radical SAM enzyme (TIGR03279 family)
MKVIKLRSNNTVGQLIHTGDEILSINGEVPLDVIEYHQLVDADELNIDVLRDNKLIKVKIKKDPAQPLGLELESPIFDKVRTCDNHCDFCFIYQLPKGLRKSLYQKDDDFRLSFLYGNFTTLTRFTEADLERVVTQNLSPLYVSIHATDPEIRAAMLKNPNGATSLIWLKELLDAGIEVHGQLVICPDVNDKEVLVDTLYTIAEIYPDIKSIGAVPLGVSKFNKGQNLRPHTKKEADSVLKTIYEFQELFKSAFNTRKIWASDEYYIISDTPFENSSYYEELFQYENGIGMASVFADCFLGNMSYEKVFHSGFFSWVDGASEFGYRSKKQYSEFNIKPPIGLITGEYGAFVLDPLVKKYSEGINLITIKNEFFGGNVKVSGLLTGYDLRRQLDQFRKCASYLLPDSAVSSGVLIDGTILREINSNIFPVPVDGAYLNEILDEALL